MQEFGVAGMQNKSGSKMPKQRVKCAVSGLSRSF